MKGQEIISALKKKLRVATDGDLADRLGVTPQAIKNWKIRSKVTPRQIAWLIQRASRAATSNFQMSAIRPLVEFFHIEACESARGAKYELFSSKDDEGRPHSYRAGLKEELDSHFGVYVFFDSRGQAIYAGKAKRQTLWKEMNGAFNRDRGFVQKIRRVRHPERQVPYRTSEEKARQIIEYAVPLHELAAYFSAYQVVDGMIDEVEALLVRSFANDVLNIRMERFGRQRKKRR